MSAISGLVRFDQSPVHRDDMVRVLDVMSVYGSDRKEVLVVSGAAFAWNSFAVTPEDRFDDQPVDDYESKLKFLFDGRLDNRSEIAARVGIPQNELSTLADSVVAFRLVRKEGKKAPDLLRGDFALACWDSEKAELWLARDPSGSRPLFWYFGSGFAAFSSMPKGLFCLPGIRKRLNQQYLEDYVLLLPPEGDLSLFEGVHRVLPGAITCLNHSGPKVIRYHDFRDVKDVRLASDKEYYEAFRYHLDNAVKRRLRSETPVASYLSSGLDSTAVAARAALLLAEENKRLACFTAVPAEGLDLELEGRFYADEGPGARAVAEMYSNIDHYLVRSGHVSPLRDLDEVLELLDRPPLNPVNAVWVNEIQRRAASQGCKVLLQGTRGNATISYNGAPYLAALFKSFRWFSLARHFLPYFRARDRSGISFCAREALGPFMPRWLWAYLESRAGRSWLADPTKYTALNMSGRELESLRRRASGLGVDVFQRPPSDGRAARISMLYRVDSGEYRMLANARGVDERDPTADRDLTEFCLGIPESLYLRNGRLRWILRQVMRSELPRAVLYPSGKGRQAADWFVGASADLEGLKSRLDEVSGKASASDLLDVTQMKGLVDQWPAGGWGSTGIDAAYADKLFRGITVGAFVSRHDPRNRPQAHFERN